MTSHKRTSSSARNGSEIPLQNVNTEAAPPAGGGAERDFEERLEQTLHLFKLKAARQIAYELPRITAKVLEEASADFHRRVAETAETARVELHGTGQQLTSDIRAQLAAMASDSAVAFGAELKATSKAVLETAARSMSESAQAASREAEDARERMISELRKAGAALLQDAEQQLERLGQASSTEWRQIAAAAAEQTASDAVKKIEEQAQTAIADSAGAALARLQSEQQKFQTEAELKMAAIEKQLVQLSSRGVEDVRGRLDAQLDDFQRRLRDSVEAMEQKALDEAMRELPRASAELMEAAAAELQKRAGDAAGKAKEEVRASAAGVADEIRRDLLQQTEDSLSSLRESAIEQSKSQLRQLLKEAAAENHKAAEKELGESLRKARNSAQIQVEELVRANLERLRAAGARVPAAPARGSFTGKAALVMVALIPTVLFAYLISRPVMRLKGDPPAEFVNAYPEWTGAHQADAAQLGAAYWDWAALHLTDSFPYGSQLPEQPPPSFTVDGKGFPAGVDADVARMRYWQKLRDLWTNPQSWQKIERWNIH